MTPNELKILLPELCYTVVPLANPGERVGVIKRGERGYHRTDFETPKWSEQDAEIFAAERNAKMEITPAQRAAMEIGSMFGWNSPGADPRRYDANGNPSRRTG
jgi:hypothetical protein